jgi:muramoyltetrapeptide carboxypeptidase
MVGHVAGNAEQRAADINAAFADPAVSGVFCAIGGDHSNQLLNYIDFDTVRENPKPLVGYSDVTVLLCAMLSTAGVTGFYGPTVLTGLAEFPEPFAYTMKHLHAALFTTLPSGRIQPSAEWTDEYLEWSEKRDLLRPRRRQPNFGPKVLRGGTATGPLVGGCLPSLMHLRGTRFWPNFDSAILFLETPEGNYTPADADSHLCDLELTGVFDVISGMVVGRPYGYTPEMRANLESVIVQRTRRWAFPILTSLDFGHTEPMVTLPLGIMAKIDSYALEFRLLESGCTDCVVC